MWTVVECRMDPADPTCPRLSLDGTRKTPGTWLPAYRDTVDGVQVAKVRGETSGPVWLDDGTGPRRVYPA